MQTRALRVHSGRRGLPVTHIDSHVARACACSRLSSENMGRDDRRECGSTVFLRSFPSHEYLNALPNSLRSFWSRRSDSVRRLVRLSVRWFVRSSVRRFIRSSVRLFVGLSVKRFVRSSVRRFLLSSARHIVRKTVFPFVRKMVCPVDRPSVNSKQLP